MTLDGTNTYVVGAPGSGQAVLVDPGRTTPRTWPRSRRRWPPATPAASPSWSPTTTATTPRRRCRGAARFGARWPPPEPVAGPGGRVLEPGERLALAGTTIGVVPTPGHTGDHLAFRLESGAVLVGDHVLGRGTSVVTHPEGDVVAYLESLRRVHDLGPSALYCGHGPELTEDPAAVLDFYLAHRAYREQQLLEALAAGPRTVDELVDRLRRRPDRELWPAAAQSTRATLAKLRAEGRVEAGPGESVRLA
jgi:glyoxylase-like metal-dependent hydrolase (beta-lactamase superfamily II)